MSTVRLNESTTNNLFELTMLSTTDLQDETSRNYATLVGIFNLHYLSMLTNPDQKLKRMAQFFFCVRVIPANNKRCYCNVCEALICKLVYLFIVFGEHGRYIGNINHLW